MVRVVLGFEVHSGGGGGGSHGGDNGGGGGGGNRDGVESFSSHGYDVTNISSTRLHRKDRDGAGWDRQNFYNETNPRTDI